MSDKLAEWEIRVEMVSQSLDVTYFTCFFFDLIFLSQVSLMLRTRHQLVCCVAIGKIRRPNYRNIFCIIGVLEAFRYLGTFPHADN